jgi:hypothetical protein
MVVVMAGDEFQSNVELSDE